MKTAEYGTHLIQPYEGAGAAFEGIWKRWHLWEWAPDNTCRVEDLIENLRDLAASDCCHDKYWTDDIDNIVFDPRLKTALATPDLESGKYSMTENPGYGCLDTEVEYNSWPDLEYEAAQRFIAEFEAKLLAWCKSIDGAIQ